jgi:hypothetical protein
MKVRNVMQKSWVKKLFSFNLKMILICTTLQAQTYSPWYTYQTELRNVKVTNEVRKVRGKEVKILKQNNKYFYVETGPRYWRKVYVKPK